MSESQTPELNPPKFMDKLTRRLEEYQLRALTGGYDASEGRNKSATEWFDSQDYWWVRHIVNSPLAAMKSSYDLFNVSGGKVGMSREDIVQFVPLAFDKAIETVKLRAQQSQIDTNTTSYRLYLDSVKKDMVVLWFSRCGDLGDEIGWHPEGFAQQRRDLLSEIRDDQRKPVLPEEFLDYLKELFEDDFGKSKNMEPLLTVFGGDLAAMVFESTDKQASQTLIEKTMPAYLDMVLQSFFAQKLTQEAAVALVEKAVYKTILTPGENSDLTPIMKQIWSNHPLSKQVQGDPFGEDQHG